MNKVVAFIAIFAISLGHFLPSIALAEELMLIVNKANPISSISRTDLVKIFKAEKMFWKGGEKIVIFMRETGSPEREAALKLIYKMSEDRLKKFWLKKVFTGEASTLPKDLSSAAMMKELVASTPNAIGYLFKGEVDDTIKILKVDSNEALN